MWRASALLAGNVPAEGDLQLDEMGIPPAVPLPLGDVRLDVAGPPAIVAVRVETDKCPDVLNPLSVGDVNLPAPARRAEADGSWRCHLTPSSGLLRRSSPRRSVPTPRHVKAAASAGLNGGGSLLHNPSAAGRVQVILDGGFTGEEKLHPVQGKPFSVIPGGPAAAGQRGDVPINIALPNDDL